MQRRSPRPRPRGNREPTMRRSLTLSTTRIAVNRIRKVEPNITTQSCFLPSLLALRNDPYSLEEQIHPNHQLSNNCAPVSRRQLSDPPIHRHPFDNQPPSLISPPSFPRIDHHEEEMVESPRSPCQNALEVVAFEPLPIPEVAIGCA